MTIQIENTRKKRRAQSCPECKSQRIAERVEEDCSVCLDCGFVISAQTAKFIMERKAKTSQHVHVRRNSHSVQAASLIDNKESNQEKILDAFERWKQVKIWDSTEKNLASALGYMTKIAADLSLSDDALKKATLTYKRIIQKGLLKGRSMKAICATAVYIGCKQCKVAITIRDLAIVSKLSLKKISHSYRSIFKRLALPMQTTSIGNHASEIATRLQSSARTKDVVEKTVEALDGSRSFGGKSPSGIACATVYISSLLTGEKRSQREIAAAGKVTETTIRSRCREIERKFIFSFRL